MALPVDPQPTKPASGTLADAAEIKSKFDALYAYVIGGQAEADFFKPGSGIYDAYKVLLADTFGFANNTGGGGYAAGDHVPINTLGAGSSSGLGIIASGQDVTDIPKLLLHWVAADHAVTTKTLKMRMRAHCLVNSIAPGVTFKVGLYPVSLSGGLGGRSNITLGAVVAGSQVTFAAPGASSINPGVSGDFTIPADGLYVVGLNLSAGIPAGSTVTFAAQLQARAV